METLPVEDEIEGPAQNIVALGSLYTKLLERSRYPAV